ncbi:hypothetical protein ACH4YO_19195 [Streptomyces noursei]|uniref:hypothetical protein n=1 Tax=Streptomyces noursei TaxID=1971 RepID=UPI00340910BC
MTVRSGWLVNRDAPGGGQTRADTRLVPVGTWTPNAELTSRGGVVPGGNPFALTSAGAMQCTIGTGRAVISGSSVQGAYPVAVTEPETLTIADGDAQYPRKDAVFLRVYDSAYDGSDQSTAALIVAQGTPSAHPEAPVASGTAEKLYEITVPAGTSAGTGGIDWATVVSDRRRTTVSLGGIQAGGWGLGYSGAYPGQYRDNGRGLERWDGNGWRSVAERHYVAVRKDDAYNLAANRYTPVRWSGTDARTDATMWTPTNPTRLVAPVGGLYTVYAQQTWPGGAEQARVMVTKNGGVREWHMSFVARSNGGQGHAASLPVVLQAGDFVEVSLYTAAALDQVPGRYSIATLRWEGPA